MAVHPQTWVRRLKAGKGRKIKGAKALKIISSVTTNLETGRLGARKFLSPRCH